MFSLLKDPVVIMKEIMSWLLRIQLTITWLNLTMPNQTVKNSLKTKKIELPQMKNLYKKNIRVDSEDVHHFWDQNSPFVQNNFFFWYKPLLLLSSTYDPFHCVKFKRNLTMGPELWRCTIYGPKGVDLPQIIFFSENL